MPRQSLLTRRQEKAAPSAFSGNSFQVINGRVIAYNDSQITYLDKGYNINDIVYSIVDIIIQKAKVAPWGIYTITDESAYKQLQVLKSKKAWHMTDFPQAVKLFRKSLKPVDSAGYWGELMKYANEGTPFSRFVAHSIAYKLLTGNNYIWARTLSAGANKGIPYDFQLLPAQHVSIDAKDSFPVQINGYTISQWPLNKFTPEEILHQKEFNPNWDSSGQHLYGQARMRAALSLLKKNNSLNEAEMSVFENKGINGIMHTTVKPGEADDELLEKQVKALKKTMVQEWTGPSNRGRFGISGYEVGYIPVGLTNEEMQMTVTTWSDVRRFCNVFGGVPSQLLNDPENKTYNSLKEAEKAVTSRCVLPHLCDFKDDLNTKGHKYWALPEAWVVDFDITAFGELQADATEVMTWAQNLTVSIPNEERELVGLAAISGEEALDKPWIKQASRQPLEDFQASQTDNALMRQNDIQNPGGGPNDNPQKG